ncbi:hypothetical protein [Riemerella anatipestifer]|nr:hypothetical protein [Riemerella anatipestifer]MCU7581605.1 hypothetical protein [Riemerella anatipestifer]MDD1550119.1 hypothetical protein [Riemerella anatipestifer]MSN87442.1 hypothetical protein [Riemerella anatipestifer]MSN91604.1 hypothetical protein [Riemerella anatipestifer]MSN94152.1 hypothetical protein [Riemerella anatipestifer]
MRQVLKASSNAGLPTPKRGEAILALNKEIIKHPVVGADLVTLEGSYIFKPGTTFIKLYMTPSTQAATSEAGGNPDGMGSKNKFVGEHPGTEKEIMSFLKRYANEGFIIFYGGCGTSEYKVMGSQCHPMKLSPATKDDKDGNVTTLTFEQEMLNDDRVMFYNGPISFAEPFQATGSSFALSSANGNVVKLASASATANISFSSSDFEHGQTVSFIGGGGADPYKIKNNASGAVAVLTKDGADWIALEGAIIDFRVTVADKTYLVEVARR